MVHLFRYRQLIELTQGLNVAEIDEFETFNLFAIRCKFNQYVLRPKIAIINTLFVQCLQKLTQHSNQPSQIAQSRWTLSDCFVKVSVFDGVVTGCRARALQLTLEKCFLQRYKLCR